MLAAVPNAGPGKAAAGIPHSAHGLWRGLSRRRDGLPEVIVMECQSMVTPSRASTFCTAGRASILFLCAAKLGVACIGRFARRPQP